MRAETSAAGTLRVRRALERERQSGGGAGVPQRAVQQSGDVRHELRAGDSLPACPAGMMDREQAFAITCEFTKSDGLRKHALAVEACLAAYRSDGRGVGKG